MGTGTSRRKKVAPACVGEVTGDPTVSSKQDNSLFKPLKINAILRSVRNRAQPDSHSEGHDSDFSEEDDDGDVKRSAAMADYEERGKGSEKKGPPKRTFLRSRTYGLCHLGVDDTEEDLRVTADGNKRHSAFTHSSELKPGRTAHHSSTARRFQTNGALLEAVLTSEKQSGHVSSLTMPVISYDGAEEELMDTIEREFS